MSDTSYRGPEEVHIKNIAGLLSNSSVKEVWYCRRSRNIVAHNLTKAAFTSPHPRDWMRDVIPRHLVSATPNT